jgi:hypothetical protein
MPRSTTSFVRLRTGNTHLYPGARLFLEVDETPPTAGDALRIEFADLGVAQGRAAAAPGAPDRLAFHMAVHRTARGTTVPARSWIVEPVNDAPDRASHRIVGRARELGHLPA